MSELKPIKLYGHSAGPNPYKVQFVLEELNIPYELELVSNPKEEWFVKINPNGRVPAIIDPNTDLTLWESGAIVEYLVETYDKEGKLKGETVNDNWLIKQYLHFQMSGQGPYYGQAVWFHKFHPEDVQTAKERYEEQIARVLEVLNNILEGKKYLVGEKL
jgi:glutathione S-transferase